MVKKQRKTKFFLMWTTAFIIFFIFELAGCDSLSKSDLQAVNGDNNNIGNTAETDNKTNTAEAELKRNRLLWKEKNIVNYNFVSEQFAGGLYPFVPVQIKVRNSNVVSIKSVRKKLELQRIDGYDEIGTVEKMFDKIQSAIGREVYLTVSYNNELGFPEKFSISSVKAGADMYWHVRISKFEIVETNPKSKI